MSEELEAQPVKRNHLGISYKPYSMPRAVDNFCRNVANGYNLSESYRMAYPKAKYLNPQRIMKRADVPKRIEILKEIKFKGNALSEAEKRDYLARAVRTPASQVSADSDLAQKVSMSKEGILNIEPVSKLEALREDNKMAGHYHADKVENKAVGFAFLLDFARFIEGGVKNALPPEPKAIDV